MRAISCHRRDLFQHNTDSNLCINETRYDHAQLVNVKLESTEILEIIVVVVGFYLFVCLFVCLFLFLVFCLFLFVFWFFFLFCFVFVLFCFVVYIF